MPEYIHTDELTTISQDRSIVVNQKPPKISLLTANFSQSEKFDFSNNFKTIMPKSVSETIDIPAVITPSTTTVLPSTTTVPETQQQSSNKKIYKKCCQERQVVHLGKFYILKRCLLKCAVEQNYSFFEFLTRDILEIKLSKLLTVLMKIKIN